MTRSRYALLTVPMALCILLTGCGRNVFLPYTPPVTTPLTTGSGNWWFFGYSAASDGALGGYYFGGSLINNGGQVSGVLHIDQSCFGNYATDVPYTGTLDSKNNLSITSSSVAGQILALQGTLSADGLTLQDVNFTVRGGCSGLVASGTSGSGPSLEQSKGFFIPSLTGTWASNAGAASATEALSMTEQIVQSPIPDAHGDYALSGTVTVQGSPCFTKGTLQTSFISGVQGQQHILMDDGSTLDATMMAVLTTGVPTAENPETVSSFILFPAAFSGGLCDGSYEFKLNK
jgi:hypothetical protein